MIATFVNHIQSFFFFTTQFGLPSEYLGITQDAIEGGAHFMTRGPVNNERIDDAVVYSLADNNETIAVKQPY